jgi:hypothetical protein
VSDDAGCDFFLRGSLPHFSLRKIDISAPDYLVSLHLGCQAEHFTVTSQLHNIAPYAIPQQYGNPRTVSAELHAPYMDAKRISAPQCTSRMQGAVLERPVSSSQEPARAVRSGEFIAAIVWLFSHYLRSLVLDLPASCLNESQTCSRHRCTARPAIISFNICHDALSKHQTLRMTDSTAGGTAPQVVCCLFVLQLVPVPQWIVPFTSTAEKLGRRSTPLAVR